MTVRAATGGGIQEPVSGESDDVDDLVRRPDRRYPGYLFDLDGTIYLGEDPLPGVVEVLAALTAAGSRIAYLSNKPLERPAAYAATLRRMGIPASDASVVSSLDALVGYLREHPPGGPLLTIAEPLIAEILREAGHGQTDDPGDAAVVIVSWDRTFDYAKLERAFRAVRSGARIVATNPDPFCPTPDGGLPDCGAILAAIEVATGTRAEAVVGKPSEHMSRVALERLGLAPADVVMVGDRLLTDVAMARAAGMVGALVLTGATSAAGLRAARDAGVPFPDLVLADLRQLLPVQPEGRPS